MFPQAILHPHHVEAPHPVGVPQHVATNVVGTVGGRSCDVMSSHVTSCDAIYIQGVCPQRVIKCSPQE